ncbi:short-chain dehydrogenase [Sulfitobacter sp. SK012]|nr:short-chain dehydrogenase [Sulfitobacter sp. SK012]
MDAPIQPQPAKPPSAFFSIGLRPFFLLGSLWAVAAMTILMTVLAGGFTLPSRFDPVSWHAHAFLFGYLGAIIAGFLLTAVLNWTGRPPLAGWPLLALVLLWCMGRLAVLTSALFPLIPVIIIDLSFPLVLGAIILREIIAGQNWRNLVIVILLASFTTANLVFHVEAAQGAYAAQGFGLRMGLATGLMMIALIGGRVIPTFTRNWLKKTGRDARPADVMQGFDKLVLFATLITLLAWLFWPKHTATGGALLVMAGLHAARLLRWKGTHTKAEPLVWVLHVGYAFVPIGAAALGGYILWPDAVGLAAAQHIWMAGAIGLMTLAVMTRATLGHTGRDLRAGPATVAIYLSITGSVFARLSAGIWPEHSLVLYMLAGVMWMGAFGGFAIAYGSVLLQPKCKNQ